MVGKLKRLTTRLISFYFKHSFLRIYNGCIFMRTIKFTSWQDDNFFIGFLNDYPDYLTQGMSKEELEENLRSLLVDLESDEIPYVRKVEELMVA